MSGLGQWDIVRRAGGDILLQTEVYEVDGGFVAEAIAHTYGASTRRITGGWEPGCDYMAVRAAKLSAWTAAQAEDIL